VTYRGQAPDPSITAVPLRALRPPLTPGSECQRSRGRHADRGTPCQGDRKSGSIMGRDSRERIYIVLVQVALACTLNAGGVRASRILQKLKIPAGFNTYSCF
jgi:hypothetical protein